MESVQEVLVAAVSALRQSEKVEVPLGWRVRLWAAMNAQYPNDSLLRRGALAFLVARRTLPAWHEVRGKLPEKLQNVPNRLVENCRRLLLRELSAEQANDYSVEDEIQAAMSMYESVGRAVVAAGAAHAALECASGYEEARYAEFYYPDIWDDEFVGNLDEANDEWMAFDTHYWAAWVAGGALGELEFDPTALLRFWQHWLREDVPYVSGSIMKVDRLLRDG